MRLLQPLDEIAARLIRWAKKAPAFFRMSCSVSNRRMRRFSCRFPAAPGSAPAQWARASPPAPPSTAASSTAFHGGLARARGFAGLFDAVIFLHHQLGDFQLEGGGGFGLCRHVRSCVVLVRSIRGSSDCPKLLNHYRLKDGKPRHGLLALPLRQASEGDCLGWLAHRFHLREDAARPKPSARGPPSGHLGPDGAHGSRRGDIRLNEMVRWFFQ